MKKLAILAVLACMVFGFAATASAVDLDAAGQFNFQMNIMDNQDYLSAKDNGNQEDDLNFWLRARTQFRFIANENLWAVLYTEYKTRVGSGVESSDSDDPTDSDLRIKNAYMQYRFPGTEILTTAGLINLNLPGAAAGNVFLADADTGLFMVETPITDQISIAAAFVRYADANSTDGTYGTARINENDELDIFYGALPITIDGLAATPYFAYALVGKDSGSAAGLASVQSATMTDDATAWWAGTSFSLDMFDPIVFNADIVYGSVDADQKQNDRSGMFMDASLAYTGLDFVQPKLVFAYGTGEDDDTDNGSERLPIINNDFAFGSTYFGGSALTGDVDTDSNEQMGMWTIGLSLEKISFFEKLSHDIHFLYIKGTNDADLIKNSATTSPVNNTNIQADGKFLTDKDSAFEIDLNTTYQIYDELAAIVEFGYVNVDFDKDTWENAAVDYAGDRAGEEDPLLKFAVGLVYKF